MHLLRLVRPDYDVLWARMTLKTVCLISFLHPSNQYNGVIFFLITKPSKEKARNTTTKTAPFEPYFLLLKPERRLGIP
jgi:hypothetical protein